MKILSFPDNYPEKYWFSYAHEDSIDHLKFYECKTLPVSGPPAKMKLKPKVSLSAIRQYDYLSSDGPDFISSRFATAIRASWFAKEVQLINIHVEINGEAYHDYFIINPLASEAAFDMNRSTHKPLIRSMPNGPKSFSTIILLNTQPEKSIFRAAEKNSHIIISDEAAEYLKAQLLKGVEFPAEIKNI